MVCSHLSKQDKNEEQARENESLQKQRKTSSRKQQVTANSRQQHLAAARSSKLQDAAAVAVGKALLPLPTRPKGTGHASLSGRVSAQGSGPAPLTPGEHHWRRLSHPLLPRMATGAPWQHAHTHAPERSACGMPPCARAPPLSRICSLPARMPKHASSWSKRPAAPTCGSLTYQRSSQPHVEHRHEPFPMGRAPFPLLPKEERGPPPPEGGRRNLPPPRGGGR